MDTLGISRFEFADGTVLTRAQFEALITLAPTTVGTDLIYGGAAPDILTGGAGNDKLVGEDGNDTYIYRVGDGDDLIRETESIYRRDTFSSDEAQAGNVISTDTLAFGPGISRKIELSVDARRDPRDQLRPPPWLGHERGQFHHFHDVPVSETSRRYFGTRTPRSTHPLRGRTMELADSRYTPADERHDG